MTYTKTFLPEKFAEIQPLLDAILELSPGASIDIEVSFEQQAHTRWLIYNYLFHMERQGSFKIRTLHNRLIVEHKAPLELSWKRSGEAEERIDQAVKEALCAEEPGEVLRQALQGEELAEGIRRLQKALQ